MCPATTLRLRRFGMLCALAVGLCPSVSQPAQNAPAATLAVWAIGLPDGYIMMERQPALIHITADDVARGVIEVRDGSRLVIATATPSGYIAEFRRIGRLFKSVQIGGIGSAVEIGPEGGQIVAPHADAGRRVIAVSYRFMLAPDTVPGTYEWPLAMAVRASISTSIEGLHKHAHLTRR